MEYLKIKADISIQKINEFNQSKLSFINGLSQIEGYSGFTEKTGQQINITIGWINRKSLDRFLETDLYRLFHGALITLSTSINIDISSD